MESACCGSRANSHGMTFLLAWSPARASRLFAPTASTCALRRRRRPRCGVRMHFIEPAHSLPEFIGHIAAACGVGLAGIMGSVATADVRATLARSRRRQHRLSRGARLLRHGAPERDWDDVENVLHIAPTSDAVKGSLEMPPRHIVLEKTSHRKSESERVIEPPDPDWFQDPAFTAFDEKLGPPPPPAPSEFSDTPDDNNNCQGGI